MPNTTALDVLSGETPVTVLFQGGAGNVSYAISGGADAALFTLDYTGVSASNAARLVFRTPPDISRPADAGADNIYDVEITATASSGTTVTAYQLHVLPDDYSASVRTTGRLTTDGERAFGSIATSSDSDWFRFDTTGGSHLIAIQGGQSAFEIFDEAGQRLRFSQGGSNGEIVLQTQNLTAGTYYLAIGAPQGQGVAPGSYTVAIAAGGGLINGTDGNDGRTGTASADWISGNGGDDTLIGLGGTDYLFGFTGNDSLGGGDGHDFIRGGDGNDSISGGADFDDTHGNAGNDTVSGGTGNDWVVGGKDDDLLSGDAGEDLVYGNLGNDTCIGGDGADIARGGQGNDSILGGAGNDYVSGDRGDDTVAGGTGADIFHSFAEAGIDRVLDFNYEEGDRVILDAGSTYTVAQTGADVLVSMASGQVILMGVNLSALGPNWIVFG